MGGLFMCASCDHYHHSDDGCETCEACGELVREQCAEFEDYDDMTDTHIFCRPCFDKRLKKEENDKRQSR